MPKSAGIPIKGTRAVIYGPTESVKSWRIAYIDRATGKRKTTTGGQSREEAEAKARALSGEYVEGKHGGEEAPTVEEAVSLWLTANRSEWSSRTYDQYYYFGKKLTELYADRLITTISPMDIAKLMTVGKGTPGRTALIDQTRGQQEKARTLIRGIFGHFSAWITKERANNLARGITLSGNVGGKRNPRVERGDIPSPKLVASLITTAYHTMQIGPLDPYGPADESDPNSPGLTTIDPVTGEKSRASRIIGKDGIGHGAATLNPKRRGKPDPDDLCFLNGLPAEIVAQHRRGMPKHYSNPAARRTAETEELATRYRMIGLSTALGAGGGLRIGEILALRVRHFFTVDQIHALYDRDWDRTRSDYSGVLDVSEQASQASRGVIWISGTKGATKSRTVHLPAFLPNWHSFGVRTHRDQIGAVVPRLADRSIDLWSATDEESIELWRAGFTPLAYLLWDHLWDTLWHHRSIEHLPLPERITKYRELLLFPTRNRLRPGRERQPVQFDPSWHNSTQIVDGSGGYQAQSNYAKLTNPLYDYVEQQLQESPKHRTNRTGRKGWTHHGLRHWAVSSRIQAGIPLPVIAREMGHKDSSFTLERYGHVVDGMDNAHSFEY